MQAVGSLSPIALAKKRKDFVKIRNLNPQQISDVFALVFVRAASFLGIKEAISEINKQDIKDLILFKYSHLSAEELDYAFKHDRYSGDPIPHYQLFNAEYVAKILKRYEEFLKVVKAESNSKLLELPPVKEYSDSEKKQIRADFEKLIFSELKETGFSSDAWLLYADIKPKLTTRKEVLIRLHGIVTKRIMQKKTAPKTINRIAPATGTVENICRSIVASNFLKHHLASFEDFKNAIN